VADAGLAGGRAGLDLVQGRGVLDGPVPKGLARRAIHTGLQGAPPVDQPRGATKKVRTPAYQEDTGEGLLRYIQCHVELSTGKV